MGETSSSWHLISRPRLNSWWKELPVDCKQTYLWTWVSSWHRCHNSRVSHGDQVTRVREAPASCTEGAAVSTCMNHFEHWQHPDSDSAGEGVWLGEHFYHRIKTEGQTGKIRLPGAGSPDTWSSSPCCQEHGQSPEVGGCGHGWLTPPLCPARPPAALVNPQQPPCRDHSLLWAIADWAGDSSGWGLQRAVVMHNGECPPPRTGTKARGHQGHWRVLAALTPAPGVPRQSTPLPVPPTNGPYFLQGPPSGCKDLLPHLPLHFKACLSSPTKRLLPQGPAPFLFPNPSQGACWLTLPPSPTPRSVGRGMREGREWRKAHMSMGLPTSPSPPPSDRISPVSQSVCQMWTPGGCTVMARWHMWELYKNINTMRENKALPFRKGWDTLVPQDSGKPMLLPQSHQVSDWGPTSRPSRGAGQTPNSPEGMLWR